MSERPSVSVIVPTFRRPGPLASCLESLIALRYPRERLEVIVVDDGSGAPPSGVIERAAERLPVRLHVTPHGGPGAARNAGAAVADGSVLAFTDDDCAPQPEWLDALTARLAASPDAAVGGQTVNALPNNAFSSASQLLVSYLYEYFANPANQGRRFFTTNNLALPREGFRDVGGFDPRTPGGMAEDRDLCARWMHSGRPLVHAPEAIVRHSHRMTLRSFWRQHHRYGRAALYVERARARRAGEPIRLEPLSFYWGMLTYPFANGRRRSALLLSTLIAATQVAYAHGVVRQLLQDTLERGAKPS